MGNLQVRFLEGRAPAMAPSYSTVTRLLPQQCQAQVIALWYADTESMLVDAELHLPRVNHHTLWRFLSPWR
jgi:hypothetical protein